MALTIFTLGLAAILCAIIFDHLRNKRHAKVMEQSLEQTGVSLKRSSALETELQEEIGSLQARVDELLKDPVTHLPAWPLFADRVTQVIHECERYHLIMGVLYVDINDFKTVNSALGHNLSDAFLREVAKRLQPCIRQVDMISRQSKDVFVILLARLAKPETAVVVAQRILYELAQPFDIEQQKLGVTANIGLAMYPTDGTDAETLMLCAEQALQLSKMKGKHGFQFYRGELQQQAQREIAIYSSLSRDAMLHEFKLYFQPVVNIQDESIYCLDTVLRWHHPEVGALSTHEIFSYAEKQNKLLVVSEWLVRAAVKQFSTWRASGFTPRLLSIPLSIKSLESGHFVQHLAQILKELKFDPSMLIVEIPENFVHSSFEILEKSFNILRYLGVKIALDHFGAGSLALRYLKAFPFDYFKLEQLLIDDLVENQRTQYLLKSVLALANNLSVEVIVQGVETQSQVDRLKELGCILIEGSVLGAPVVEGEKVEALSV